MLVMLRYATVRVNQCRQGRCNGIIIIIIWVTFRRGKAGV